MAISNKCKGCGGSLEFNPSSGNLICKKCGTTSEFDSENGCVFHTFDMNTETVQPEFNTEVVGSHCPSCGAIYGKDTVTIADVCDYCGAHLVSDFSLSKGSEPDACIPFAFDKNIAKQKFKEGIAKKKFLPNKFKRELPEQMISSEYIPAYLFNVDTVSEYKGRIYNTYKDSNGDTERDYRRIAGTERVHVRDVVVESSSKITQVTFDKILPYDLTQLKEFQNEFLMGYSVENFDKKLQDTKSMLKEIIACRVRKSILDHYSYDGVDFLNINTEYKSCNYARIILPTYKFSYRYGKKDYNTYVNAQTGKVGGNVPRSKFKIFALVLGVVAAVSAFVYLIFS